MFLNEKNIALGGRETCFEIALRGGGLALPGKQPHMQPFRAFKGDFTKYHDMSTTPPTPLSGASVASTALEPRNLVVWPTVRKTSAVLSDGAFS